MKILIDIGHPAHVHYFRNFIIIMENKGHKIIVTARDKDVTHMLLHYYKINFFSRGEGSKYFLGKLLYLIKADYRLYRLAKNCNPDLILSFGSAYAAHISKFIKRPHVAFDDTEHAKIEHLMYAPFSNKIFTPSCFKKFFGEKHIKFNGYMELSYLHPNYFSPNPAVLDLLGVKKNEKYIIIRFVAWNATHDTNISRLTLEIKKDCVFKLSKFCKVFISSEEPLPNDLNQFKINIPPDKMHDALYYSSYLLGESGTMTAECAMLGVPATQISGLPYGTIGTLFELENKYSLIKVYEKFDNKILDEIISNINNENYYRNLKTNNRKMINDKIDVTKFMTLEIEKYK